MLRSPPKKCKMQKLCLASLHISSSKYNMKSFSGFPNPNVNDIYFSFMKHLVFIMLNTQYYM